MLKKVTLKQLFEQKSCWGWAWECKGKRHYYCWHNDNDLGLLCDIDECVYPETVLRRISIAPRRYVYILRNNWGINEENSGDAITLPQLKAALKECHKGSYSNPGVAMTKHDKMLASRAFGLEVK